MDEKSSLAKWMHASGTEAETVARLCSVSPTAVRGWMRGDYKPVLEAALTIDFISNGEAPIEGFGFSSDVLKTARDVENRRRSKTR